MIKEAPGNYRFDRAKRNFRVQYGLRDSFQKAMVNSTPYLKEMERIFTDYGLPVELTRLPFAESSFNVEALSPAGAAGIWQFTRPTGKIYLKMDSYIDELDKLTIKVTTCANIEFFGKLGVPELGKFGCDHDLAGYPVIEEDVGCDFRRMCTLAKGGDHCLFEFYRRGTAPDNAHLNK